MNVEEDEDLLWIAREGLTAPLPEPWEAVETGDGEVFFRNKETHEATYVHPMDEEYRELYRQEKQRARKELVHGNVSESSEGEDVEVDVLKELNSEAGEEDGPENLEELFNEEKEVI